MFTVFIFPVKGYVMNILGTYGLYHIFIFDSSLFVICFYTYLNYKNHA